MTSDNLLRAFLSFYERPFDPRCFAWLIEVGSNYDFSDTFEVLREVARYKVQLGERRYLARHKRKKETNRRSTYDFGNDRTGDVLDQYEAFIKGAGKRLLVSSGYFLGKTLLAPAVFEHYTFQSVRIDPSIPEHVEFLENHIRQMDEPVNLVATPSVWIPLTTHECGREMLSRNHDIIESLTNTNYDMFMRREGLDDRIRVKDQMIDWFSGGNFYTCDAGKLHWLPFFLYDNHYFDNLVNLSLERQWCSDEWVFGERELCECGKYNVPFRYTSHKDANIDLDRGMLDWLDDSYKNLQFYEFDEHDLRVFYSTTGEFTDRSKLESYLRQRYPIVSFYENMAMGVGRKNYNFWKGGEDLFFMPCRTETRPLKLLG